VLGLVARVIDELDRELSFVGLFFSAFWYYLLFTLSFTTFCPYSFIEKSWFTISRDDLVAMFLVDCKTGWRLAMEVVWDVFILYLVYFC